MRGSSPYSDRFPSPAALGLTVVIWGAISPLWAGEPSSVASPHEAQNWIARLADHDVPKRWQAVYALGQMGPPDAAAVPQLSKLLAQLDEDEYVRGGAAWTLGRIGPDAKAALPLLVESLEAAELSVRRDSAWALGQIGSPKALDALLRRLGDEDQAARIQAAAAAWKIGHSPRAKEALVKMLRDADSGMACEAALVLGELALESRPFLPELLTALRGGDADLGAAAAWAIGQVGPTIVPELDVALRDSSAEYRRRIVDALQWIGHNAVPALTKALADENPSVRRLAARALGRQGPAAQAALTALMEALQDTDPDVREEAGRAVARIRGLQPAPKGLPTGDSR